MAKSRVSPASSQSENPLSALNAPAELKSAKSAPKDAVPTADVRADNGEELIEVGVLPLNNVVGLPGEVVGFNLQNPQLIGTVKRAHEKGGQIFTYRTQSNRGESGHFGCLAKVKELSSSDRSDFLKFKLEFLRRAELMGVESKPDYLEGFVRVLTRRHGEMSPQWKAFQLEASEVLKKLSEFQPALEGVNAILKDPLRFDEALYRCLKELDFSPEERENLLQGWGLRSRGELLLLRLHEQLTVQSYRRQLSERTKERIQRMDHQHFLEEERRLIDSQLNKNGSRQVPPEFQKLADKLEAFDGPIATREVIEREFERLLRSSGSSPQAGVHQDYIESLLDLPWEKHKEPEKDWQKVQQSLENSHYGLEKIKKRVLEHLAIYFLNPQRPGAALCFVGPPGVGKTSFARAVAEALDLPFIKKSLGGVRDESEIRGHRRTYVGAMPGRIMQGLRKAECKNPVFLLDEVDKLGRDNRGDPADALLEVLDPDENSSFSDHYIELEFDLSKVFWILTANSLDQIPAPLLDRLEVVEFSGYTESEKLHIAQDYLCQRNFKKLGLDSERFSLSLPEAATLKLIRHYTREAGVRELYRSIGRVLQHEAHTFVGKKGGRKKWLLSEALLSRALGPAPYLKSGWLERDFKSGVMAGLAYTPAGGSVLRLEANLKQGGENRLQLTGKLGEVMQESARTAHSFIINHQKELKLEESAFKGETHIHVPAGAVSKEGPSAGLGLALLLYSLYSNKSALPFWAVTGEMSLHGKVLPVGGLKEKILAARREGFKGVLLPKANKAEVEALKVDELENICLKFVDDFFQAQKSLFGDT